MGTPTQAAAAATDEDPDLAAHSVPTPLPGPSPELTMRSDFITPPTQILGGNEASEPEEAPSSRQQKTNPDEPLETSLQHQVLRHVQLCQYRHGAARTVLLRGKAVASEVPCRLGHRGEATSLLITYKALQMASPHGQACSSGALQVSLEEQRTTDMSSYIARGKVTPYMERKLRALQAEEWSDQDAGRVHKGRLERERAAALAARSDSSLLCLHRPHP